MKRLIFSMLLITMSVPAMVFTQEVQPVPRIAAPQPAAAQQARLARAREADTRAREMEERARNLEMREREIRERTENLEMRERELSKHAENLERREMELKSPEREMELQQLKAKLDFQQRKQEIELEEQMINLENARKENNEGLQILLFLLLIIHILCAVWVYQDIQKRARESGIWIVIALLTGLLGTLVYAIVRLGDNTKSKA